MPFKPSYTSTLRFQKEQILAWRKNNLRIPSDADRRSEVMAIAIPN
jgi:hypothetical protein